MIRTILWDNDGILVDTEHLYYQATQQVLARAGIEISDHQYRELFLVQSRGAWHLAEERGYTAVEIEAMRDERNRVYGEMLATAPLVMDGVTSILEQLHGRYQMAIVTSSRKDHFDIIHANSGLLKYFDFVISADDFTHSKPHPEPYLKAIARAGVPASECIAIEDSGRGLAAATAAGLRCVVIPTPLTAQSDFGAAYRMLPRLSHLLEFLDSEKRLNSEKRVASSGGKGGGKG